MEQSLTETNPHTQLSVDELARIFSGQPVVSIASRDQVITHVMKVESAYEPELVRQIKRAQRDLNGETQFRPTAYLILKVDNQTFLGVCQDQVPDLMRKYS